MSVAKIIRAWKDADYRASLTDAERAQLPAHPAGLVDLSAAELDATTGGYVPVETRNCTSKTSGCS